MPLALVLLSVRALTGREIRAHARKARVLGLVVVAATMAVLATSARIDSYRTRADLARELMSQRLVDQARTRDRTYGWDTDSGLRVIRAPEPASVAVAGLDEALPAFWDFGPAGLRPGSYPSDSEAASVLAQNIDVEFIIRIVLGMLAVSLALDAIAGERASGTLAILLLQPVPRAGIVTAKLLAGGVVLAAAVAVVALAVVATVRIRGVELWTESALVSIAALCAVGLLYLMACFAGGLLVASVVTAYLSSVMVGLLLWVLAAVAALPAADLVANVAMPLTPEFRLRAEVEELSRSHEVRLQTALGDRYAEMLGQYADFRTLRPSPDVEQAFLARWDEFRRDETRRARREIDGVVEGAESRRRQHARVARAFAAWSPAAHFAAAAADVASVGGRAAERWRVSVRAHHAALAAALFDDRPRLTLLVPRSSIHPDGGRFIFGLDRKPQASFAQLPRFEESSSALARRLADATPSIAALALYNLVFLTGAYVFGARPARA